MSPVQHAATQMLSAANGPVLTLQQCKLVQVEGPGAGRTLELKERSFVAGKDPSCSFALEDPTASRRHFEIERQVNGYVVRDLGSTNGTFLNDTRVKEAYLYPGHLIRAGSYEFQFLLANEAVRIEPQESAAYGELVGRSVQMRQIFALLTKVAATDATILLTGETGTGKGAMSRSIHQSSNRASRPFVVFNCGVVTGSLMESELFGHVKGAFTGAESLRRGALEAAGDGTLFIDELDDLPRELQPKLLQAIEERTFQRLGSTETTAMRARIVAGSKQDLWGMVARNEFREDLYFRLSVVTVRIPPLRERLEDLDLLVDAMSGAGMWKSLDAGGRRLLQTQTWPGNVRELRNVLEKKKLLGLDRIDESLLHAPLVATEEIPVPAAMEGESHWLKGLDMTQPFKSAKEELTNAFEREYLRLLLTRSQRNIAQAAREADLDRKHLYTLLKKHGLE